jgi:hypothetical protein
MQKRVEDTLEELIAMGEGWSGTNFHSPSVHQRPAALERYITLRIRAMNIISRGLGSQSDHCQELRRIAEGPSSIDTSNFPVILGTLQSALADLRAGLLFDMRSLIEAELLGDFIEQAETLLKNNYYVPAASLIGAVLEDVLRKLCVKNSINLPQKTTINWLNTELARKGQYDQLVSKRIIALADIRNNADHGYPDRFKHEDVDDMIGWVRRFSEEHLK